MEIIKPSFEIINEPNKLKLIEIAGRTAYKSEDKITNNSAEAFVAMLIRRGHTSVLEHANLVFEVDFITYKQFANNVIYYHALKFFRFSSINDKYIISANLRALREYIIEANDSDLLNYCKSKIDIVFDNIDVIGIIEFTHFKLIDVKTLSLDERMIHDTLTVRFITDRGISHELVRHRLASFTQESTRYVNYGKHTVTFIAPPWITNDELIHAINEVEVSNKVEALFNSFDDCNNNYSYLINLGMTPQFARGVLINAIKTEIVMTTSYNHWNNTIFPQRTAKAAHPQVREIMIPLKELIMKDGTFNPPLT